MAQIKPALIKLFGVEGGYVNDPDDAGGETKYGISKRSYPNEDIKHLTLERAAQIYERDFWNPLRLSEVQNQVIAEEIFDTAVNCGTGTEARIIQEAINLTNYPAPDIAVDGQIGPATIAAINGHKSPRTLYKALNGLQFARYRDIVKARPEQEKFMRSWLSRVYESEVA
ncbi:MAG TPA: secretion activating protein [Desulfuromonas sp.]|nr:secretion activating protein [Desulfuromonas sp.]